MKVREKQKKAKMTWEEAQEKVPKGREAIGIVGKAQDAKIPCPYCKRSRVKLYPVDPFVEVDKNLYWCRRCQTLYWGDPPKMVDPDDQRRGEVEWTSKDTRIIHWEHDMYYQMIPKHRRKNGVLLVGAIRTQAILMGMEKLFPQYFGGDPE